MGETSSPYGTLGAMLDGGHQIGLYCRCGHEAKAPLALLAERLGPDHGAMRADLLPYLRCSKCGARGEAIQTILHPNYGARGQYHYPKPG